MRRRFWLIPIALVLVFALSCDNEIHEHTFSSDWTKDKVGHWHAASCEHADIKDGFAEHDWEVTEEKAPTCKEKGSDKYKCKVCGYEESRETPTVAHDLVDHEAKEPGCVMGGWNAYQTCSRCDYTTYTQIPATGHTVVDDVAVDATCTEDGKTEGIHCSICGMVLSAQNTIPATGHTPVTDEGVDATCTEDGKTAGSHCSVCNAVIEAQNTVPANGHTPVTDAAVPATCTEGGKTAGSHCSVCNAVLTPQNAVPANGHTPVADNAIPPTCTVDGKTAGSHCSVCNAVLVPQETVPATGHTFNKTVFATNETNHWRPAICEHTEMKQNYLPHVWGEPVVTDATCTTPGSRVTTCNICNYPKVESIPATGHSFNTSVWAKDGENHWHASTCGHDLKSDEAAHTWNAGEVTTDPTCTTPGVQTYTCTVCAQTKTESVPATGHSFNTSAWAKDEENHWHASTCGHDVKSDNAAHTWNAGVVTTDPTCTTDGVKTYTCTVCAQTRTESVPATGHSFNTSAWTKDEENHWHASTCGHDVKSDNAAHTWNAGVVTTAHTCTTPGVKTYTCTVCSQTKTEAIPASHTWDSGRETASPSCTSTGTMEYECTKCDATKEEEIPVIDHTTDSWEYDGDNHWKTCSECYQMVYIGEHVAESEHVIELPTIETTGSDSVVCSCGKVISSTTLYAIGSRGPAGGWVFYDCDADNDSGNGDGLISSVCGWRYIEASPSELGSYVFGYYRPDGENNIEVGTSYAIGSGKENTVKLFDMDMMGVAYSNESEDDTAEYAAGICLAYEIGGYDDWFLPSEKELEVMIMALNCEGGENHIIGCFDITHAITSTSESRSSIVDRYYWSSTEIWYAHSSKVDTSAGYEGIASRFEANGVRAVRYF